MSVQLKKDYRRDKMPLSDKVMNIFKKIKIKSPKTNQDIKLSSALTSDDPLTKKVGVKKAKDIIQKAKDSKKEPQKEPQEKPKDEPQEKPKTAKLSPELQKVKDDAVQKAEKMAKENPMVTSPIQTRKGVFYPGERQHYHQTGYDPFGQYSVQIAKTGNYDASTDNEPMYPNTAKPDEGFDYKEAKEYVKENKEEVLKYVIKRIIKEELDAS